VHPNGAGWSTCGNPPRQPLPLKLEPSLENSKPYGSGPNATQRPATGMTGHSVAAPAAPISPASPVVPPYGVGPEPPVVAPPPLLLPVPPAPARAVASSSEFAVRPQARASAQHPTQPSPRNPTMSPWSTIFGTLTSPQESCRRPRGARRPLVVRSGPSAPRSPPARSRKRQYFRCVPSSARAPRRQRNAANGGAS
jgi:hypothetical protein